MKNTPCSLSHLLILLAALLSGPGFAQEKVEAQKKVGQPKMGGTYLSATGMMPPLPYHPYPDLPTFEVGKGQFAYDDSKVDYATIHAEAAEWAAKNAKAEPAGPEGNGGGMELRMMDEDLRLDSPHIVSNSLKMTVTGNDPELPYDLYARASIAGTNAWTYVGRLAAGETNVTVPLGTNGVLFLQLGTTYDGDGDHLPDAYEVLVAQLDPNTANTLANTPAGNPALEFMTNVPPRIVPRAQEWLFRFLQLWPNGATPGFIYFGRWDRFLGGTETNISLVQSLPPEGSTNLIESWDAQGNALSNSTHNMLYKGMVYRDWAYFVSPVGYDYKDKVVTKVDVFTGGYPLSVEESLHVLLVGAQTYTGDPPYQGGPAIPNEDFTVRGQHPDADNRVWFMLPDNEYVDVTPVANPNYTNYTFGYTPYKVHLGIFRDGIEITNDVPSLWVGEEAKMDCRLVGAPANFTLSNFLWTIPGLAISNYYADSKTGRVDAVFSKTNNEVKYYWVNGMAIAEVLAQAVVNGFTLSAVARFEVKRPNAVITAAIHSPVTVDNNFQFTPALHFGNKNAIVGIRFTNNTDHPSPQDFDWVQVGVFASRYRDANDGLWYRAATNGLDTSFPYGGETLYTAADSPGIQLKPWYLACSHGNAFTMYLIFKPPVTKPRIWVPLRSIVWGWSGQATNSAGNWILVPNSGSSTVEDQDVDTTAHPTWERNIQDYFQQFVPE